jgi:putative aldouronate transport system permease protein
MNSESYAVRLFKSIKANKSLYIMILPVLAYYILFCYKPMYGAIIAFKEFVPGKGIWGSPWVGFQHFTDFFQGMYFGRILKNTIVISLTSIVFGFPAPIILALLINELKNKYFRKTVQAITYMPHFISLVVVCGMISDFTRDTGVITHLLSQFGFEKVTMLTKPELFVPIYIISGIWQEIGWGSIIYLAALTNIDQQLYEAAEIDGAGRWKQMIHVTLPCLIPTILVMLVLRMGGIMNVGFEKIILLYNPGIYDTADVISSFVYRSGIQEFNWSFSTAVGLFNSTVNFSFLIMANWLSRKLNDARLW